MTPSSAAISQPTVQQSAYVHPSRWTLTARYLRRNKSLVVGLLIILGLTLFTVVGSLTIDTEKRA